VNNLPVEPLSPEQQQKLLGQMYLLMAKQVKSYHKYRRMGDNSSVPVELARELMESVEYTVNLVGGASAHQSLEDALRMGQKVLESRTEQARSLFSLVEATAPKWQTECRWDALQYLGHYLAGYDFLHMAHKGPEALFYPILISPPEGIQGIDSCLFYLNILWIENQIMASFSDEALEQLWRSLPADTLNQCEQLLVNALGKAMLGADLEKLTFEPEESLRLLALVKNATKESLLRAAEGLCQRLGLRDENARDYAKAATALLAMWQGYEFC
jgi:hypothetical protein